MKQIELNGQTIIDTFQYQVCENYDEALEMGINDYGWSEDDVLERTEKLSVKLEGGEIINTKMSCIMVDSGSEDYIYYL